MYETIVVFWGFLPTDGLERSLSSYSHNWGCLGHITNATFINVPYRVRCTLKSPIFKPLGVLIKESSNLDWVCCYRSANCQVNWSFLPYLRVPLVKALQPAPYCLSLYWAKAFVVVSGCHLIGQCTHLLSSEREASSGIYHNNFFNGSFLV